METAALWTTVVEDVEQFTLLEKEWTDLYLHASGITPFQSWSWMYSWWESYGAGYELRIVTIRSDSDLLVGLVPLMIERRGRLGRLLFIGTRRNDYQDVLARKGLEQEVATAVRLALRQLRGWQVADLHQLRPGSVGWSVFSRWDGPRTWIRHEGSPIVEVKPLAEIVASLSKNQRSTVRRSLRLAAKEGLHAEPVRPDDATRAARQLVALHRELWQERHINSEHKTQRWAGFIEAAAQRTLDAGLGEISEFRRDGKVVMSLFWLIGPDFVGFYHAGVGQEVLRRYQWNALLVEEGIRIAESRGVGHIDLLRGEQPYKMQWASSVIPSQRGLLGRHLLTWAPYAAYFATRSRLEQYLFSPQCPLWVRQAARAAKRAATSVRSLRGWAGTPAMVRDR